MLPDNFWDEERRRLLAILLPKIEAAALAGITAAARKSGLGLNLELANREAAAWARKYTDELLDQVGANSQRAVGDKLAGWIEQPGATMGDLVNVLSPALANNTERADLIAVTETTRAYANGERAAYEKAGIKRWRWNTNRDELVCRFCGPLNGKVVEIGDAFGSWRGKTISEPPGHPGCRCWVSPVVGKRASEDRSSPIDRQRLIDQAMRDARNIMGFSFNQDSSIPSVAMARALGEGPDGWAKHEARFLNEYLPKYKLQDDIERTIGLWGSPEPSFNARLKGRATQVEALAKEWGRDYNQQAMAMLLPSKAGTGGKLIWEFGQDLTDEEFDHLLQGIITVNRSLAAQIAEQSGAGQEFQIGLTVRGKRSVEFWYSNANEKQAGIAAINRAMQYARLNASRQDTRTGYEMKLLFQGSDY